MEVATTLLTLLLIAAMMSSNFTSTLLTMVDIYFFKKNFFCVGCDMQRLAATIEGREEWSHHPSLTLSLSNVSREGGELGVDIKRRWLIAQNPLRPALQRYL